MLDEKFIANLSVIVAGGIYSIQKAANELAVGVAHVHLRSLSTRPMLLWERSARVIIMFAAIWLVSYMVARILKRSGIW